MTVEKSQQTLGRGSMALGEFLRQRRKVLLGAVGLIAENIAREAADVYAPKGASYPGVRSLAKGIVALKPRFVGNAIQCSVVSTARSSSGFDYAKYQHDTMLAHVTFMPRSLSYVDFGGRGNREQRYSRGYKLARRGSPRYKSEYLYRAGAATQAENKKTLEAALS